jgi:predicted nucleotide-binding protein (sugar kinase/HSP70/actin superfamily)
MPSGAGPCRFGQYNRFHRLVLDELGLKDVPLYAPNQDESFYQTLGAVGAKFTRLAWQGIIAVDILEKKLRETRPYEKVSGEADKVYQYFLKKVSLAIKRGENLTDILAEARNQFDHIEQKDRSNRSVIGIVGEIYIRCNQFSNENIIKEIESLGGEVWLPPVSEWFHYINFTAKRESLRERNYFGYFRTSFQEMIQRWDERSLEETFHGALRNHREPTTKEILKEAKPYLDSSFEGEAILSIGKTSDFIKKGVDGIINVMPFTCMPGTIVNALLKRFREDNGNVPFLNMAYDGQEQTNTRTRLEAFMHQAKEHQNR